MWGLITKDLKNLKAQAKLFVILGILYLFLGIQSGNFIMFGGFFILMASIIPITALAYDERSKWDKYALTMPLSRTQLVLSKYLLGLLLSIFITVVTAIIQCFFMPPLEAVITAFALFGAGLLITAILMPITFKLGVEKGRVIMMVVFILPAILGVVLSKSGFSLPTLSVDPTLGIIGLIVGILAIYLLSLALSVTFYKKKEF